MTKEIHVHMLPVLTTAESLAGQTVVVIDVLRATTTIVYALAAGASKVIPCLEVDEAQRLAAELDGEKAVLGGERGGVRIEGFDLGNSPSEYRPDTVGNKTVVFTTTNGTRAMSICRSASTILLGAFVNLSAVCDAVAGCASIHLLCAGTGKRITREDVLLAGAICDGLVTTNDASSLDDQAELALDAWRTIANELATVPLVERLRASRGGRNMLKTRQEGDIDLAARIDSFDIVPQLDAQRWSIEPR